jgi:PAS domain S-box-containing protein
MWFEVHAYPSAEGLSIFYHDITGRKQADAVRQRLASIVESSDDAIISESLDSTIITWNSGAERLYGYTAEEAIGKSISMLVPFDRKDDPVQIVQQIVDGERIEHYRTVRVRKSGEYVDVSLTVSPLKNESGQIA